MEVDRLPDGRTLAQLSLAEIKEQCALRNLSKAGSRKDLTDRLKLRLELEKLREEASRTLAKEDVVPNIGLQDTPVGQSDIVRQYLEAQQRRLLLFGVHRPHFENTAPTQETPPSDERKRPVVQKTKGSLKQNDSLANIPGATREYSTTSDGTVLNHVEDISTPVKATRGRTANHRKTEEAPPRKKTRFNSSELSNSVAKVTEDSSQIGAKRKRGVRGSPAQSDWSHIPTRSVESNPHSLDAKDGKRGRGRPRKVKDHLLSSVTSETVTRDGVVESKGERVVSDQMSVKTETGKRSPGVGFDKEDNRTTRAQRLRSQEETPQTLQERARAQTASSVSMLPTADPALSEVSIDDPIEAALLALHGAEDSPGKNTKKRNLPFIEADDERPQIHDHEDTSSQYDTMKASLDEVLDVATDRIQSATVVENGNLVPRTSLVPVSDPFGSEDSASGRERLKPFDKSPRGKDVKSAAKELPKSVELKAESVDEKESKEVFAKKSTPAGSPRTEVKQRAVTGNDRTVRETRKRSKVENIVQKLTQDKVEADIAAKGEAFVLIKRAVLDGQGSSGDNDATPATDIARSEPSLLKRPRKENGQTSNEASKPLETSPPCSGVSPDECVLRLLGEAPKVEKSDKWLQDTPKTGKEKKPALGSPRDKRPKESLFSSPCPTSRRSRRGLSGEPIEMKLDSDSPKGDSADAVAAVAAIDVESGRRDSVEAAVAALIGEPLEPKTAEESAMKRGTRKPSRDKRPADEQQQPQQQQQQPPSLVTVSQPSTRSSRGVRRTELSTEAETVTDCSRISPIDEKINAEKEMATVAQDPKPIVQESVPEKAGHLPKSNSASRKTIEQVVEKSETRRTSPRKISHEERQSKVAEDMREQLSHAVVAPLSKPVKKSLAMIEDISPQVAVPPEELKRGATTKDVESSAIQSIVPIEVALADSELMETLATKPKDDTTIGLESGMYGSQLELTTHNNAIASVASVSTELGTIPEQLLEKATQNEKLEGKFETLKTIAERSEVVGAVHIAERVSDTEPVTQKSIDLQDKPVEELSLEKARECEERNSGTFASTDVAREIHTNDQEIALEQKQVESAATVIEEQLKVDSSFVSCNKDIVKDIEQEVLTKPQPEPDDLWEAVFCADQDGLPVSDWPETSSNNEDPSSSYRQDLLDESETNITDTSGIKLPHKFQPNVESAVASILDLNDIMRPSSSLSSHGGHNDNDTSVMDNVPDADTAVAGLLSEAPFHDEQDPSDLCIDDEVVPDGASQEYEANPEGPAEAFDETNPSEVGEPSLEEMSICKETPERRISEEVRSVTGDVVESVATTSLLVDVTEQQRAASPSKTQQTSPALPALNACSTAASAKIVPAAQEEESVPRLPAQILPDVKGGVNLSEESSSDSESEDDARDKERARGKPRDKPTASRHPSSKAKLQAEAGSSICPARRLEDFKQANSSKRALSASSSSSSASSSGSGSSDSSSDDGNADKATKVQKSRLKALAAGALQQKGKLQLPEQRHKQETLSKQEEKNVQPNKKADEEFRIREKDLRKRQMEGKLKKQQELEKLEVQRYEERLKKQQKEDEWQKQQEQEKLKKQQKDEKLRKEQEEKLRKEEEEYLKKKQEEELRQQAEKEKVRKQLEEEHKLQKQQEELLEKRRQEVELRKKREEELRRQEEEENLRKQQELEHRLQKQREVEENLRKQEEEETLRKQQKNELKRQQEDELKKQQELRMKREQELMKQQEELKKKEEELLQKRREEEGLRKKRREEEKLRKEQQEQELLQKKEAEEKLRKQEAEEKLRKQEEEKKLRKQEEREKLRKQEAEKKLRKQEAEEKLRKQEAEEKLRKQEEEKKLRKQQEEEKLRKQEAEEKLRKQQEEEKLRKQQEEDHKKQKEEELRKQQEEALRKKQEEDLYKQQQLLRKQREEELRKKREEELRKQKELELRAQQEELKKQQEEKLKKQREEKLKKQREEELKKQKEEELKKQKEEELKKQKEEELKKQKEEELKKQREEELKKQKEEKLKKQREEELKRQQEEELKKQKEEDFKKRREEELKKQQEEELKREQEEELKKQREEELKKQQEEQLKKQREEELKKQREEELKKQREEELKKQREEELRKQREEELKKQREEELKKQREEELRKQREEELKKQREEELKKQREEELRKQREEELKKQREEELKKQREEELRKQREEELKKQREEELKKQREEELRKQREEELKKQREEELKKQREEELKKQREEELRKRQEESDEAFRQQAKNAKQRPEKQQPQKTQQQEKEQAKQDQQINDPSDDNCNGTSSRRPQDSLPHGEAEAVDRETPVKKLDSDASARSETSSQPSVPSLGSKTTTSVSKASTSKDRCSQQRKPMGSGRELAASGMLVASNSQQRQNPLVSYGFDSEDEDEEDPDDGDDDDVDAENESEAVAKDNNNLKGSGEHGRKIEDNGSVSNRSSTQPQDAAESSDDFVGDISAAKSSEDSGGVQVSSSHTLGVAPHSIASPGSAGALKKFEVTSSSDNPAEKWTVADDPTAPSSIPESSALEAEADTEGCDQGLPADEGRLLVPNQAETASSSDESGRSFDESLQGRFHAQSAENASSSVEMTSTERSQNQNLQDGASSSSDGVNDAGMPPSDEVDPKPCVASSSPTRSGACEQQEQQVSVDDGCSSSDKLPKVHDSTADTSTSGRDVTTEVQSSSEASLEKSNDASSSSDQRNTSSYADSSLPQHTMASNNDVESRTDGEGGASSSSDQQGTADSQIEANVADSDSEPVRASVESSEEAHSADESSADASDDPTRPKCCTSSSACANRSSTPSDELESGRPRCESTSETNRTSRLDEDDDFEENSQPELPGACTSSHSQQHSSQHAPSEQVDDQSNAADEDKDISSSINNVHNNNNSDNSHSDNKDDNNNNNNNNSNNNNDNDGKNNKNASGSSSSAQIGNTTTSSSVNRTQSTCEASSVELDAVKGSPSTPEEKIPISSSDAQSSNQRAADFSLEESSGMAQSSDEPRASTPAPPSHDYGDVPDGNEVSASSSSSSATGDNQVNTSCSGDKDSPAPSSKLDVKSSVEDASSEAIPVGGSNLKDDDDDAAATGELTSEENADSSQEDENPTSSSTAGTNNKDRDAS